MRISQIVDEGSKLKAGEHIDFEISRLQFFLKLGHVGEEIRKQIQKRVGHSGSVSVTRLGLGVTVSMKKKEKGEEQKLEARPT